MRTTCIVCPNGCQLTVKSTKKGMVVTGNQCPRGEKYGIDEASDPRRVVTAVARTTSDEWPCVPVKTTAGIPKKTIARLLLKIYAMKIDLPVKKGDVVIPASNTLEASVVITRTLPSRARIRRK